MKNPFKKKSGSKETIQHIQTLTGSALIGRANECTDVDQYIALVRIPLNQAIVEAMLGCKISREDKKVKFSKKLPTTEQIANVAQMVESFIQNVETPTLKRIATLENQVQNVDGGEGGDMSIPVEQAEIGTVNVSFAGMPPRVQLTDKATEKKLRNQIFSGYLGGYLLNGADCVTLASMGKKARSTANRNKILIVGGIAILLTGLAVAGVMFYKHKKKSDGVTAEINIDGETIDVDVPSAEEVEVDVDAPHVEME